MASPPLQHSFPPVADDRTRLLLLGSLPGAMSLAAAKYYANPRNHFWQLVGGVLDLDLVGLGYDERLATLLDRGVGLWDTVGSGRRRGSLDANIRLHEANDLRALTSSLPTLAAIGFNGGKSASIGRRQLGTGHGLLLVDLPSSSPAYTLPFERKREAWLQLRRFL